MIRKSAIVAAAAVLALLVFIGCSNGTTDSVRPAETYTVTYNANGADSGTVPTDGGTYIAGDEVTVLGNTGGLALNGYAFSGWNTAADDSGTSTYLEGATFTMGTGDVTLYATWSQNVHTLSFDANGGSGTMAVQTVAEEATVTLPVNTFTYEGYTFVGWATGAGRRAAYTDEEEFTMGTADVTLYAVWTPTTYTIIYTLNGGTNSASNPATYTIESATITLADPSGTDYTFGGWYSDSVFEAQVTGIPAGSTGSRAFYAKWTPQGTVTTTLKEEEQITVTGTGTGDSGLAGTVGATLTIGVNGSDIYASYQWYRDGQMLDGATGQTLEITLTTPGNYTFTVVVTNDDGNGFSESVIVTVTNSTTDPDEDA